METLAQSLAGSKKGQLIIVGAGICVVWAAIAIPGLNRSRTALGPGADALPHSIATYSAAQTKAKESVVVSLADAMKPMAGGVVSPRTETVVPRKVIRTSSLELVIAHPAETVEAIAALVDGLGGYVETSNSGAETATAATLTVRVPSDRFEQARMAIRKLALHTENERIDAQDVTRQYVDQDASLRNLRAEEAQYLTILKQATTVKDMLAVSEKLSEVRGEIEQQEAEFHSLSRQIETVSIAISLRTQAEERAFGLNWRPLYQVQLALHDGLESIANYASVMVGILFYLPATLLWVATIAIAALGSWRIARWAGQRWFGWTMDQNDIKG
jgi:hypothetical protein